jgi:sulfatase maturation enzyme AslB (radical SAM superfamily)
MVLYWLDLLVGLTGGEPFINPEIISLIEAPLRLGQRVLILSNAYNVMDRHKKSLLRLLELYGNKLSIRVSLDHYEESSHDKERGEGTFNGALKEIKWLIENGFSVSVASRTLAEVDGEKASEEIELIFRQKFQSLFDSNGISLDARSQSNLILFAEMNENLESIKITEGCWSVLGKSPKDQMCSQQRMIVKRRGQKTPEVVACTLIPYSDSFSLGKTLKDSLRDVELSHPYCAQFCVLGGSSCS